MRARAGCPSGCGDPKASEAGFALVEVMVSAVLLIVLALSTLAVLDQSGNAASANRSRGVASSLAQADLDRLRQTPIGTLANLRQNQTKTVSNINYAVVSRADWVTDASGLVTCAASPGQAQYMKIRSTVTWPNMNGVAPVVAESIVAPGVAALGPNRGAMTAKIVNDAGVGVQGVPVNVGGYGDVTDAGGCVVFGNLPAGSMTVTIGAGTDFVNKDGVRPVVQTQTIVGAQTSQLSPAVSMDHAGTATVNIVDDATPTPNAVSWPTVSLANSGMSGGVNPRRFTRANATDTSIAGADLFPFISPYAVYAGNCAGNNPSSNVYTGSTVTPAAVLVPAGGTAGVGATLPRVKLNISGAGTNPWVLIKPKTSDSRMSGCTETFARQQVTSATPLIPLPYGVWTVCVDNGKAGGTWKWASNITYYNTPAGVTGTSQNTALAGNGPLAVTATTSGAGQCT